MASTVGISTTVPAIAAVMTGSCLPKTFVYQMWLGAYLVRILLDFFIYEIRGKLGFRNMYQNLKIFNKDFKLF